jgi:hypothetical protein
MVFFLVFRACLDFADSQLRCLALVINQKLQRIFNGVPGHVPDMGFSQQAYAFTSTGMAAIQAHPHDLSRSTELLNLREVGEAGRFRPQNQCSIRVKGGFCGDSICMGERVCERGAVQHADCHTCRDRALSGGLHNSLQRFTMRTGYALEWRIREPPRYGE